MLDEYYNRGCVDAMGKGTQIQLIENELEKRNKAVHIVHYSNIKFTKDNKEIEKASALRYREMFNLMKKTDDTNVIIFDRAHLGETVYSPIYRGYTGDFVFDFEKQYVEVEHPETKLILFTDTVENVIARDKARGDGLSFSLDPEKKAEEIKAFNIAFENSWLDKKLIALNGRTPEQIFNEDVYPFIFGDK
mgnify:CR=1 FL=1